MGGSRNGSDEQQVLSWTVIHRQLLAGHDKGSTGGIRLYKESSEDLRGGFPSEDFAGSLVEHLLGRAELLIGDERQVDPIGLVVADPAVLAFAGAALPGAERVAEEHLQLVVGRQKLVLGRLLALVVREGLEQRRRETFQFGGKGIPQAGRVRE